MALENSIRRENTGKKKVNLSQEKNSLNSFLHQKLFACVETVQTCLLWMGSVCGRVPVMLRSICSAH